MNKKFLSILSALLLSIAALSLIPVPSSAQPCAVISAHDGDSLRVRQPDGRSVAVRLYGVDCPELGQPYGKQARDLTGRLVGQVVDVRPTGGRSWGRVVAVIELPDGGTLQAALVDAGLAWVDGRFCRRPECDGWRQAQEQAREARRGLWADDSPVPPWVWRRAKR